MTVKQKVDLILDTIHVDHQIKVHAQKILSAGGVTCLWFGDEEFGFHCEYNNEEQEILISLQDPILENGKLLFEPGVNYYACLLWLKENYLFSEQKEISGKIYTREGMMNRVFWERKDRSIKAKYKVIPGKFYYGEHILYNEKNEKLFISLWDIDHYEGYVDNIDWKTNKLATTKHIIFLCDYMKEFPEKFRKLPKLSPYLEITLDPLHDYQLTWKYNGELSLHQKEVIKKLFPKGVKHLHVSQYSSKVSYLRSLATMEGVVVRPEVYESLALWFDNILLEKKKLEVNELDFSCITTNLFPYQKEGVHFCLFRKGAVIADEMGLGKTLQAITTAILKRKYLGFRKTLIICPSSVKYQWKTEIVKFTGEESIVIEGQPEYRKELYLSVDNYFFIVNYETVMRDFNIINTAGFDFIILDEAQKIKNFETKTSGIIGSLQKEHGLVLTGTPIENKLTDLYSIILFLDKYKVTPLWEFSYQHCVFDNQSYNKINGYYNLSALKQKVSDIIIRRQKKQVLDQLPSVIQKDIFILLSGEQASMHSGFGRKLAQILAKKFKTPFDWEEIMILMTNMRRVSNSTFLIDKTSNSSSKLAELEYMLTERLNVLENKLKVIIFSEWIDSLMLIEQLLEKLKIGYVKLTGKVAAKKRGELIKAFETKDNIQVFLSTESGGTGLNLQFADTLINFEIPWNPAKKNQRIGRIDRIGQKSSKLHVYNLICRDSIEIKIASGLMLKQNLFDNVLNHDSNEDFVDFSNEGKAQFFKMLEEMFSVDGDGLITHNDMDEDIVLVDSVVPEFVYEEEEESLINENRPSVEYEKLEQVLSKGMEFLSGLFEMTTGEKLGGSEGHNIKVNKETGEVTLTFKMKL